MIVLYAFLGFVGFLATGLLMALAWTAIVEFLRWRRHAPFRRHGYLDLRVRRDS